MRGVNKLEHLTKKDILSVFKQIQNHFNHYAIEIVKEKKYFYVVGGFSFTSESTLLYCYDWVWQPALLTSHNKIYA